MKHTGPTTVGILVAGCLLFGGCATTKPTQETNSESNSTWDTVATIAKDGFDILIAIPLALLKVMADNPQLMQATIEAAAPSPRTPPPSQQTQTEQQRRIQAANQQHMELLRQQLATSQPQQRDIAQVERGRGLQPYTQSPSSPQTTQGEHRASNTRIDAAPAKSYRNLSHCLRLVTENNVRGVTNNCPETKINYTFCWRGGRPDSGFNCALGSAGAKDYLEGIGFAGADTVSYGSRGTAAGEPLGTAARILFFGCEYPGLPFFTDVSGFPPKGICR